MSTLLRVLVALILLGLSACASIEAPSLYQRLGETPGITAIVDEFLYELASDEDVLPLFSNTDIDRFRSKLIEQLCVIADGPCEYTGDTMSEAHRHMSISHAQFNSVVTDLIRAMERREVPTTAQNALLKRLARLYPEVVNS